jgi:hypothetical protein
MSKGLPYSMARGSAQRQEIIKQTVKLRDFAIRTTGASGVGFGTAVIGDLPEGNILFLGALANLSVTKLDAGTVATFTPTVALGTAPTADATLSAAEVDLIPATALTIAVAGVTPIGRVASAVAVAGTIYDNTDGAMELNLNMTLPDLDVSADDQDFLVNGEVYLAYIPLGDD